MQTQQENNEFSSAVRSRIAKRRRLALVALSEELKNVSLANDSLKRLLNEIRPHFFDDHAVAIKIDAVLNPANR
ncbi:hypothetical protein [Pseudomonas sp.]|uniref:hypothetical protein n=1 Tax=Pseudomonas sp. TaxID=306 RepID=UPI003F2C33C5